MLSSIECILYCIPEARKVTRKDFQGLNPAKELIADFFRHQYRYGNPEKYSTGIVISNTGKVCTFAGMVTLVL